MPPLLSSILMLQVAPLVAFGKPSKKSVESLIRKRGFGKVDKKRIPISDNKMVEDALVSQLTRCGVLD